MLFDVDRMQVDQAVDESTARFSGVIRKGRQLRRNVIAHYNPAAALHHKKDRTGN